MLTEAVTSSPPSHGPTEAATMVSRLVMVDWLLLLALPCFALDEERGLYWLSGRWHGFVK